MFTKPEKDKLIAEIEDKIDDNREQLNETIQRQHKTEQHEYYGICIQCSNNYIKLYDEYNIDKLFAQIRFIRSM